MLVHPKSEWNVSQVECDENGRLLCAYVSTSSHKYVVCNIYAPNEDSEAFFNSMIEMIDLFPEQEKLILGGDFNLVMDPQLDRNGSSANHKRALMVLNEYMERNNMCDIWRIRNATSRRYTWHRATREGGRGLGASRIDMFLVGEGIADTVMDCRIDTGRLTDHSLIFMAFKVDQYIRGKRVWKFNNQLLFDRKFCEGMKEVIDYTMEVCRRLDANERWETLKMEIGAYSMAYAKEQAKVRREVHDVMSKLKEELQEDLINNPGNEQIAANLTKVQLDMDREARLKAEGAIFRSRCRYVKEGEKCTSYFLSLEKKRYMEKNMTTVVCSDGTITSCQKRILQEQTKFYKDLYTRDTDIRFALTPEKHETVLDQLQKDSLDQELTPAELYDAVMMLRGNKVPGLDGLTVEFYRYFWKALSKPLFEMCMLSVERNLLPKSVRSGLISLLPKKNKDTRYVKNMRPLTLLNNDYKILAKALDNRLRTVLPGLIHVDQTGFIKGRKIVHNIRKSLDIIEYTKKNRIPGVILSIDMEKCFDRLEHTAIIGSLKYFNFGPKYIQWIRMIYQNFQICTQNFGICSRMWTKERGTNQGDPLSPGLYVLNTEIMANKL